MEAFRSGNVDFIKKCMHEKFALFDPQARGESGFEEAEDPATKKQKLDDDAS